MSSLDSHTGDDSTDGAKELIREDDTCSPIALEGYFEKDLFENDAAFVKQQKETLQRTNKTVRIDIFFKFK